MCGWHADTHPKLGRNPPVASISLGNKFCPFIWPEHCRVEAYFWFFQVLSGCLSSERRPALPISSVSPSSQVTSIILGRYAIVLWWYSMIMLPNSSMIMLPNRCMMMLPNSSMMMLPNTCMLMLPNSYMIMLLNSCMMMHVTQGSLLLMEGAVQEDWLYCLPKVHNRVSYFLSVSLRLHLCLTCVILGPAL